MAQLTELSNSRNTSDLTPEEIQDMPLAERARKLLSGELIRSPEEIAKGKEESDELERLLYGDM